jgi:hypothetical protein
LLDIDKVNVQFHCSQVAAEMLNKGNGTNGDLFVPNNAYYAMVDTVVGTKNDARRSYARDFKKLCSSSVSKQVKKGCAMMAFNFNAANSRDISTYYYQVGFVCSSCGTYLVLYRYECEYIAYSFLPLVTILALQHAGVFQLHLREERARDAAEEHSDFSDPDILLVCPGALARVPGRRGHWQLVGGGVSGDRLRGVRVPHD